MTALAIITLSYSLKRILRALAAVNARNTALDNEIAAKARLHKLAVSSPEDGFLLSAALNHLPLS